ncbi:MAG: hormogonium polysaccharide biosynthesis glycosyltransferase HpsE [Phormidesmis sp.]
MSQSKQPPTATPGGTLFDAYQASPSSVLPDSTPSDDEGLIRASQPSGSIEQGSIEKHRNGHSQNTVLDITVAIPTYNGAEKLPLLLDQLRSQTNTDPIGWEIIVCDNGSTDDTAAVVRQYQANWPSHIPLHYRFAAEQGAAFARQYAVECAKGELIAFLDDDNVPADDWISQAYSFARDRPQVGAFGSQIHGEFETNLPDELEDIRCFLAIIERGQQSHRYEPAKKILPPAAGLVVRRQVWLDAVPQRLFLNNKGKSAGLASEDLEAVLHIQGAGWEVWYNPDMVVHHHIPNIRLRKDYLVPLFRCVGLSRYHIRLLGIRPWKRTLAVLPYLANDIRKLALHRLRHGHKNQLSLPESCHRELLMATLVSPFFLTKKVLKDGIQSYQDKQHIDRYHWLKQITQAFETDQFALYQQPVVSLATPVTDDPARSHSSDRTSRQPTEQKELLLRLRSGHDDCALPSSFLPTAKRYGLMRAIDRWVISHLLEEVQSQDHQLSVSQATAAMSSNPLYAINLSQDSVEDRSLVQFVQSKLAQSKLPPQLFCFEISATTALAAPEPTRQLIQALHTLGCKVTLDDDATVSNVTAELIAHLPIDYVKIAPATLKTLRLSSRLWESLRKTMQHHSVQAIAKGIESQTGLESAQQQGILYAQGYQMGRPQPL